MKILVLGGIGEAKTITKELLKDGHEVVYSVAGSSRLPDLGCEVIGGGFGGSKAMAEALANDGYDGLLDATHPYAVNISINAFKATQGARVPLWAYRRPLWFPTPEDSWINVRNWKEARAKLEEYKVPLISIGRDPLNDVEHIQEGQHWIVRRLPHEDVDIPKHPGKLSVLTEFGVGDLKSELALMQKENVDIVVSKNNGGGALAAKIIAARTLKLPVIILARPNLPSAVRVFESIEETIAFFHGK